jgi:competence protein ComEA
MATIVVERILRLSTPSTIMRSWGILRKTLISLSTNSSPPDPDRTLGYPNKTIGTFVMNKLAALFAALLMAGIVSATVNINTATKSELEALPDVGPARAQAIIDYRTKNGPFKSAEDLIKVDGVGEKNFASMKAKVSTSGPTKIDWDVKAAAPAAAAGKADAPKADMGKKDAPAAAAAMKDAPAKAAAVAAPAAATPTAPAGKKDEPKASEKAMSKDDKAAAEKAKKEEAKKAAAEEKAKKAEEKKAKAAEAKAKKEADAKAKKEAAGKKEMPAKDAAKSDAPKAEMKKEDAPKKP